MAPQERLPSHRGGTPRSSSLPLFRCESMANFFKSDPLEVKKEILHLEAKEFNDHVYFSDLEIGGSSLKWVLDPGKFRKRRLHFLHSISLHR